MRLDAEPAPRRGLTVLALAVLFAGSVGLWVLDARGNRGASFGVGFALHAVATIGYATLACFAMQGRYRPRFLTALLIVIALRLLALPLQPALSDDIYRYVHEGNMVLAGENPYLTAPEDVAPELRDPTYWPLINNKKIPAAYPPAMQYALATGVVIRPTPLGQKIVFGACDVLVFVVLWGLLPLLGMPAARAVIHGFCPLMALEFAGEGHGDSLAVLFLMLCLLAWQRGRSHVSATMLAIATASKLMPILFLPFVVRRAPLAVLTFGGVLLALYAPFLFDGSILGLFDGTREYGDRWRSNDSVFHLLHAMVETALGWLRVAGVEAKPFSDYPHRIVKVPVVLFGIALLVLAWRRRWPLHAAMAAVFATFVCLTPVLHPWYVAFLMPFLCIYGNVFLLAFTGTVYLAYHVLPGWLEHQVWEESRMVKLVEYVPLYVGITVAVLHNRTLSIPNRAQMGG